MGKADKKKDKKETSKKHKHKHDEKAAATGSAAADLKKAAKKAARKAAKQQQAEHARQQPTAAAAAAGGSSSPSSSSSGEDVDMTQQASPPAAAAAATQAPPPAAAAAAAAAAGAVNVSSSSSSDDESDLQGFSDDVEVQEAPPAAAAAASGKQKGSSKRPTTAAAAGGGGKAQAGKSLPEVLQAEGYVQVQAAGVGGCLLDLSGVDDATHKELWVLRLPDGVSVDSLHGRHIHIPGSGLPEACHLRAPPNPFTDPRADLLSHVQAAAPSQEVGHVSLGHDTAQRTGNHRHRELLQSHEFEASTYSIVAAAPAAAAAAAGSSSSKLKLLKVGRCIQLASDTALVDRTRMGAVSAAGAEVWGSKDGWDGVLLPRRKHRRRLGGWEVQGGDGGSSGRDEEFEEVVFLQPGEEEQQQQQQDRWQQQRQWVKEGDTSDVLHPRFYSDDEGDEEGGQQGAGAVGVQLRQLQGQEEDRALPGGNEAPFMADLQQWVLSLPVDARTAALQQAIAQQYSTAQWAADRRVWWAQPPQNTYLAPSNAAAQAKLLAALESLKDSSGSGSRGSDSDSDSESESDDSSDDVRMSQQPDESAGVGDLNADDIIVVGEGVDGGGGDDNSDSDSDEEQPGEAAAAAAGGEVKVPGYPCALPLAYLLTLPQQVEQALSAVRGVRRRQRLRNAAVLLFTDWREVWTQVDNSLLTDDELWQLVCALPSSLRQFIAADPDAERVRRLPARKAAAKTLGQQMVVAPPGPRPQYTATDAGYAPYQVAGEKKVAAAADNGATTDAEDAAIADWLIQQGAGRRAKLLGASELRGRGLDWDTDPGALAREGLHVLLPDGRDVHIPAGTDLDWQGELRRVWGF